ncbi:hypothetical protein KKJ17_10270 [Xenorhabdus bovienii]|uniref:hypothetical protein n=1 Tax=Xenorhabdus bovienii TaxID=40576 RepID=UPI0023B28CC7|nr:hypothetical protein [Xenorhabdus bovienii]MDE9518111.1 hypothetical protein [Xenorhabdus bovienii]MDE9566178.1 hypothetical protein [Xenorhabdus bovienii]
MSETKNLKESNKASIYLSISIMCVIVFLIQLGAEGYVNIKNVYAGIGVSGGASVISLLLVNIIPLNLKHIIVFWRIKHVLPGNRVVELCQKDERLNMEDLQREWPDLFLHNMPEQDRNPFWYKKIYKKSEPSFQVIDAHKNFLLFRDLCSAALVMFFCAGFLKIIEINGLYIKWSVLVFLFGMSFLFSIISRYYGNRMVTSAVAVGVGN